MAVRLPEYTEYHLSHEGEWLRGGSDLVPEPTPPRTVAVMRVFVDGRREARATTPAGERYLDKLLAAHPFVDEVRLYLVRVLGRVHGVVQARNKFEAARHAGAPPQHLEVRARDELADAEWAELVAPDA